MGSRIRRSPSALNAWRCVAEQSSGLAPFQLYHVALYRSLSLPTVALTTRAQRWRNLAYRVCEDDPSNDDEEDVSTAEDEKHVKEDYREQDREGM